MAIPNKRKLMEQMKLSQSVEGDALPKGHQCALPTTMKVIARVNQLQGVKAHYDSLSLDEKEKFYKIFGKIADLLAVNPQGDAILVAMNFWDPTLRVFTFKDMDTSPTLEEYALMLNLPLTNKDSVYIARPSDPSSHDLDELFGLPNSLSEKCMVKRGETRGWELSFVLKCLNHLKSEGRRESLCKLIALAIYGFVLFPSAHGVIDLNAAKVFLAVLNHRVNPVPAILADTFSSLNHGRRTGKGALRCCIHLLYVWVCSHIFGKKYATYGPMPDPVRRFSYSPVETKSKQEWVDIMMTVDANTYTWHLPWVAIKGRILLMCGDFQCVPLMGTRGCIAYSPALVLRQYELEQYIPRTKPLIEVEFEFHDHFDRQLWSRVRAAWDDRVFKNFEEMGRKGRWAIPEYTKWFEERGKDVTFTRMIGPERPQIFRNEPRDYEEECRVRLDTHIEEVNEDMEKVLKEKRRRDEECRDLKDKIRKIEAENKEICDNILKSSQAQVETLTEKIQHLNQTVNNQQESLDFYRQQLKYRDEEIRHLQAEAEQSSQARLEQTKLTQDKQLLQRLLNRVTREREEARMTNEGLLGKAEEVLNRLTIKVQAVKEQAAPFHFPEAEAMALYEEVKEIVEKWAN